MYFMYLPYAAYFLEFYKIVELMKECRIYQIHKIIIIRGELFSKDAMWRDLRHTYILKTISRQLWYPVVRRMLYITRDNY